MAVPKRKSSHARSAKRSAGQRKAQPATIVACANCQEPMEPHHICKSCGYYKGREVVAPKKEE